MQFTWTEALNYYIIICRILQRKQSTLNSGFAMRTVYTGLFKILNYAKKRIKKVFCMVYIH